MDFYIAIGCLGAAICLYTWLVIVNYKQLIATKDQRLQLRRLQRKARKNPFKT